MSAHDIDANPAHLYPDFRKRLEQVLADAPGGPWRLAEGYRSQERQSFLYAKGRTAPGPIVTWLRKPLNHGAGLAADVVPAAGYNAPRSTWEGLRAVYLRYGLENPAWAKGDLGHIQWPSKDHQTHQEAEDWCEAGFPAVQTHDAVPVFLRGQKIIDGELRPDGKVWAPLRPLAQALGLEIHAVTGDKATFHNGDTQADVPLQITAGKGWSPVRAVCDVAGLAVKLEGGKALIG